MGFGSWAFAAAIALTASVSTTHAQSPADFYKGKTVEIYIGYSVGGAYDVYARLLARHMGKHLPGRPTVVNKNMEGAGSLRLANWLYNVAPKDGTVFGIIGRGIPFDPLLGGSGQFDATKFSWIGSANDEVSICASWHTTGVTRFEDLQSKEIPVGGTGVSDDTVQFPKVLNAVLGTKMKIVSGYPGGNDVNLAMERGEVGGRGANSWASWKSTRPQWIAENKIHILVQIGLKRHPDLPNVPLLTELAANEEDRQVLAFISADTGITRAVVTTPDVPPERVEALRRAFDATMKDPEFLAEAERARMDISPSSGEEVQKVAGSIVDTPAAVLARAKQILEAPVR
jgi:tripartite-type tricarboxylate transporter receptor subunit TctC